MEAIVQATRCSLTHSDRSQSRARSDRLIWLTSSQQADSSPQDLRAADCLESQHLDSEPAAARNCAPGIGRSCIPSS